MYAHASEEEKFMHLVGQKCLVNQDKKLGSVELSIPFPSIKPYPEDLIRGHVWYPSLIYFEDSYL